MDRFGPDTHRWGDRNDAQRSVRTLLAGGFRGIFSLEYEAGPLNGVEGSKSLYRKCSQR